LKIFNPTILLKLPSSLGGRVGANNKQQTTNNKQQTTNNKQQTTNNNFLAAYSKKLHTFII
jgi:hypothetical protein